jgi:hypothetical protein
VIVRLLIVLDLLDTAFAFDPFDLNQRWTFVTVVVHHSSQKKQLLALSL